MKKQNKRNRKSHKISTITSIRQVNKDSGNWFVCINVNSEIRKKSLKTTDVSIAEQKAKDIDKEYRRLCLESFDNACETVVGKLETLTTQQLFDEYCEHHCDKGTSFKTVQGYKKHFSAYFGGLQDKPLSKELVEASEAFGTIMHERLHPFFNWCYNEGYVKHPLPKRTDGIELFSFREMDRLVSPTTSQGINNRTWCYWRKLEPPSPYTFRVRMPKKYSFLDCFSEHITDVQKALLFIVLSGITAKRALNIIDTKEPQTVIIENDNGELKTKRLDEFSWYLIRLCQIRRPKGEKYILLPQQKTERVSFLKKTFRELTQHLEIELKGRGLDEWRECKPMFQAHLEVCFDRIKDEVKQRAENMQSYL
jgi:hypothetical protein